MYICPLAASSGWGCSYSYSYSDYFPCNYILYKYLFWPRITCFRVRVRVVVDIALLLYITFALLPGFTGWHMKYATCSMNMYVH